MYGSSEPDDTELLWRRRLEKPHTSSSLPDAFLSALVAELDTDAVTALVLVGSHARGDATPYSDVDVIRLVREEPERAQQKLYTYRDGRLLGIVTRTLAHYRAGFTVPERAIFEVPSIREAQILVDKDGAFRVLQQEARAFVWEPLQAAANAYASTVMMEYTEYVQKILRALLLGDELALSEMILDLLAAVTFAVDVQRGILAASGNSYFRQVYESVGLDAAWTRYHRFIAGIESGAMGRATTQAKGIAALRLYWETVQLLRPAFHPLHRDVVEQTALLIERVLSDA